MDNKDQLNGPTSEPNTSHPQQPTPSQQQTMMPQHQQTSQNQQAQQNIQPIQKPNTYARTLESPLATPKNSKRKIFLLVVVVLVVLGIVAGGLMLISGSSNNEEVISSADGNIVEQETLDTQKSLRAQELSANVNEQVILSNGLSIIASDLERNWQVEVERLGFSEPATGYEFVSVPVQLANNGTEPITFGSRNFALLNTSGEKYQPRTGLDQLEQNRVLSESVQPGETLVGELIFEIEETETDLKLKYTKNYTNSTTDEEIDVTAIINL